MATLRWRSQLEHGLEAPLGGQAVVRLPRSPLAEQGRVALLLDASFDPAPLVASIESEETYTEPQLRFQFRERFELEDLYRLLLALLESAVDVAAPAVFRRILGVPVWRRIGPVASLFVQQGFGADKGVGDFLNVEKYTGNTSPRLELGGETFYVSPAVAIESREARIDVVKEWLTRLLLDMDLAGFEDDLAKL